MKKLNLEEIQKSELEILKKIDEICQNLGLKYCLTYGTLLGAIRHEGFIPWDDDLDIMMPRDDYEKLIRYFNEHANELKPLKVVYLWGDDFSHAMARITDMRYKLKIKPDIPYSTEDMGTFIDVYPFDEIGTDYKHGITIMKKSKRYIAGIYRSEHDWYNPQNNKFINLIRFFLYKYAHIKGKKYYYRRLLHLAQKNNCEESRYIAPIYWHSSNIIFSKDVMETRIRKKFCEYEFWIPKRYDEVLRLCYGNYMELPPKEKRVPSHDYEAYLRK